MDQRTADRVARKAAAKEAAKVSLPAATWREIQQRAATVGIEAELQQDGAELRLVTDMPARA
jgi:hypothetical protein